jgi:hypothetical protein
MKLPGASAVREALLLTVRFAKRRADDAYHDFQRREITLSPEPPPRDWPFAPERTPELTALLDRAEVEQPVWSAGMVAAHVRGLFDTEHAAH